MKRFANFVGIFPFSGKLALRPLATKIIQSDTLLSRRGSYIKLMVLLTFYTALHLIQFFMGVELIPMNVPVWVMLAGVTYALVNASVVLAQGYLGYRMTRYFLLQPLAKSASRRKYEYSGTDSAFMCLFTLVGQLSFCFIYVIYT